METMHDKVNICAKRGSNVVATDVNGNKYEGFLQSLDLTNKFAVIESNFNTANTNNVEILNLRHLKQFDQVNTDDNITCQSSNHISDTSDKICFVACTDVNFIDVKDLKNRKERSIESMIGGQQVHSDKISVKGKEVFNGLSTIFNKEILNWDEENIIVNGIVVIEPPYDEDSTSLIHTRQRNIKVSEDTFKRIKLYLHRIAEQNRN
ncbi:hypothetical protein GJ496_006986 [Pomphorhynchus laevis]|nr:hypothetical protein GJ496_006986 [Pomphorhynchus laevis]